MDSHVTVKDPALRVKPHHHPNEHGVLVRCYHQCKKAGLTNTGFWIGMTLGFPIEHLLWTKVWPFTLVAHWFGL